MRNARVEDMSEDVALLAMHVSHLFLTTQCTKQCTLCFWKDTSRSTLIWSEMSLKILEIQFFFSNFLLSFLETGQSIRTCPILYHSRARSPSLQQCNRIASVEIAYDNIRELQCFLFNFMRVTISFDVHILGSSSEDISSQSKEVPRHRVICLRLHRMSGEVVSVFYGVS